MTDSYYNDPNFLKKRKTVKVRSNTPLTDASAYYVTKEEGPTGDLTEQVVPADLCRNFERSIFIELTKVQDFIKKDDEHCPDYSVTKNVYIRQIQDVIDKYK